MPTGQVIHALKDENRDLRKLIAIYESDTAIADMKARCDKRVQGAEEREKRNYICWKKALEANRNLKETNTKLRQEKEHYKREATSLKSRNERLEKSNKHRLAALEDLEEENERLKEESTAKDKQIEALKEEVCRLKAQIDHDGTTNGIPTSQTPLNKQKIIPNTREKTGRKKGGQEGHPKAELGALDEMEVTDTVAHTLSVCPECGGDLEKLEKVTAKDETDYEVKIIKRRHIFPEYRCKECGKVVRKAIPAGLKEKNQYGSCIQALTLALVDLGFISIGRTREILTGIFHGGLAPSEGFIGKVRKKASRLLKGFYEEAREFCLTQRILYWDDTVIFVNTARACFRFYGNEKVAFYCAHAAKDAKGIEADGILSRLTEKTFLMHDHVKYNYRKEFLFRNIECIQHMERELERVYRASGHAWAKDLKGLIQEMIHRRKEYQRSGQEGFSAEETNQFEERLERLLVQGAHENQADSSRYFAGDERNALKKLEEFRWNYFAWIYDFSLPTTNNIAESGLRMTKTKQKVSGQFLKEETASEFAKVRTYTETCKKNGVSEFEALERLMAGNPYTLQEILSANA